MPARADESSFIYISPPGHQQKPVLTRRLHFTTTAVYAAPQAKAEQLAAPSHASFITPPHARYPIISTPNASTYRPGTCRRIPGRRAAASRSQHSSKRLKPRARVRNYTPIGDAAQAQG